MKTLLCWLFAKNYFRDYPKEPGKKGAWVVRVKVVSVFGAETVRCEKHIGGTLAKAYRQARWEAFKVDFFLPYCDGEFGVVWEIALDQIR